MAFLLSDQYPWGNAVKCALEWAWIFEHHFLVAGIMSRKHLPPSLRPKPASKLTPRLKNLFVSIFSATSQVFLP